MSIITNSPRLLTGFLTVLLLLLTFSLTGDRGSMKERTSAKLRALPPVLSATKTGALDATAGGDLNGNGVVNPGDRLTYTVTIQNTGTDPAAGGVTLTDVIDANTTFVAGSVIASPIAVNESYDVTGNVGITVPSIGGLLQNDFNPNGSGTLAITTVNQAGLQGTLSVNTADGSFTFNPNPGFTGPTAFSYTLGNGTGLTDTATVSINVSGLIWFINNAGANGDGRLGTPFNSIANFNAGAADDPGDNIFIYTGSGNYDGSLTLLNNQRLIGQGASVTLASIAGVTVPPYSNLLPTTTAGSNPTIITTAVATNAVNLGTGNTIRGLTIGNTTGAKMNAAATVGTLTIGPATGTSDVILNGTGRALNLTGGGTLAARFVSISADVGSTGITLTGMGGNLESGSTNIQNSSGIGISVSNSVAGGTFNFGSTTSNSSGGTGVFLSANANNQTFAALNITPDAGQRAFHATNNTGTVTSTSGAISNSGIAAVEITNASGTVPLNVQLTSVSATGGTNGIVLTNTSSSGSPGGFRVLGNSSGICGGQVSGVPATVTAPNIADCTGGTIQNTVGAGILLNNAANLSFTRIRIANGQDDGVFGTTVTGFTLVSSLIENNGNAVEEQGLDFDNLHGTSSITNSAIRLAHQTNVEVRNTVNNGSQATLTVTGSTISNASAKTQSDDGVLYVASGTANMSVTVSGCALFANRGDHLQAAGLDSSDLNAVFTNNTLTAGHSTALGQDIVVNGAAYAPGASFNYDISGNSINGAILSAITANLGSPSNGVTMQGKVRNNIIGTAGVVRSCSQQSNGIAIDAHGAGTHTTSVTGNTMRQCKDRGINVTGNDSIGGALNLTVQSNTVLEGGPADPVTFEGSREAFNLVAGSTFSDTIAICAQVGGAGVLANNFNRGTEAVLTGLSDIRIKKQTTAVMTIRLPGYAGSATDASAFVVGMNTSSEDGSITAVASATSSGGGSGGFVGGAACSTPPPIANLIDENAVNRYVSSDGGWNFLNTSLSGEQLPFDFTSSKFVLSSSRFETVNDVENLRQNSANSAYRAASLASDAEESRCNVASSKTFAESLATYAALSPHCVALSSTYTALSSTYSALSPTYAALSPTYAAETQTYAALSPTHAASSSSYAASSVDYTASSATYAKSPETYDESSATYAAQRWISEVVSKIGAAIIPTAFAQEVHETRLSPASGETVTKALGTLPAGEQIVVQFKVTVDANIPTNDFSVVNTANITASGGININSTTATTTVVHPPTISKAFGSPSIALNGMTSLTFTIGNANPATAFTNVAFTDNLPAGLVVATPNGLVNNCGGGTVTAVAGSSTIGVSALSRPAASTCTIVVNVTGTADGAKNNTTTAIGSTQGGTGLTSNTAVLNVITAPSFTKAFGSSSIPLNASTSLSFTITNNSSVPMSSVGFTDTLPAGLVVATPPSQTGSCGGGTITANAGAGSIALSGAALAASGTCTFAVNVTGTTAGLKNNSVTLSTTELGSTPTATASLTVVAPPAITKSFSPAGVLVNETSVLTISITNPAANTVALTGVGVTDSFPAGLVVDTAPSAGNTCATGTFSPTAGAASVSISGATIPVGTTCSFSATVRATTAGAKDNITGNVASSNGGTGATASATLIVTSNSYEADAAPRPDGSGDGFVNVGDITQIRRFVAGLDLPYQSNEFQRTDSAPFSSLGDGFVNAGDVTQVRRYAAGLDAAQVAGGPTAPAAVSALNSTERVNGDEVGDPNSQARDADGAKDSAAINAEAAIAVARDLRPSRVSLVGNVLTVAVNLNTDAADTTANAVGFTLLFDPAVLSNPTNIRLGTNAPAATAITENTAQSAAGRVGIVLDLPVSPAQTFPTGDVQLVLIDFTVIASPPVSTIMDFGDMPVQRFVGDINGNALPTTFSSASVSLLAPTAAGAGISGRVVNASGRGISKARLTLTDADGNARSALTNPFGYYRFSDIPAGQTVILSITHKRYQFAQPVVVLQLNDDLTGQGFVALP